MAASALHHCKGRRAAHTRNTTLLVAHLPVDSSHVCEWEFPVGHSTRSGRATCWVGS